MRASGSGPPPQKAPRRLAHVEVRGAEHVADVLRGVGAPELVEEVLKGVRHLGKVGPEQLHRRRDGGAAS